MQCRQKYHKNAAQVVVQCACSKHCLHLNSTHELHHHNNPGSEERERIGDRGGEREGGWIMFMIIISNTKKYTLPFPLLSLFLSFSFIDG